MWTYKLRYVRCGKASCKTCGGGSYGHGPYWYAYEHRGDRVYTRYIGKRPEESFEKRTTPEVKLDERWVFKGRMDWKSALRIMGFSTKPDTPTLTKRYRELVWDHHPDHGGDDRVCAAINVAYHYLR